MAQLNTDHLRRIVPQHQFSSQAVGENKMAWMAEYKSREAVVWEGMVTAWANGTE